ncbi:uncharacterized protein LOC122310215 [Carya illinoinensis]|uniref:uncharacterized protein LOC122310215 n=1 Tax=Carya illinoinensis TaxID=32201 RepID=UPI001C726EE1|nr:uncharacterized protein LOC122310215 [Carya illinoinensis]
MNMKPPQNLNETQRLVGRVAALGRFIASSTDKCVPFFQVLRKVYPWNEQCNKVFERLKHYLASPPLLKPSEKGDILYAYPVVSPHVVSAVLIKEVEAVQHPVYYVSRALRGEEARYPRIELLAFALVVAVRKLRPYFQAHTLKVLTEAPLAKILRKPDCTERVIGLSIELREFNIEYEPRKAIKGGGMGIHLLSPDGQEWYYMVTLAFKVTNNKAEYEAWIAGLYVATQIGAAEVDTRSNSQVVVNQVLGVYTAKGEKLKNYLAQVWKIRDLFSYLAITQIPRADNEVADRLAQAAPKGQEVALPWPVERRVIEIPTMGIEVGVLGSSTPDWASSIVEYLDGRKLLEAKEEARNIKKRAARFLLIDGILYKRGLSVPLLRCIYTQEAQYVLAEIHEEICGNHSGERILAKKAFRAGYYWPNTLRNAREFANRCAKC